LWDARTGKQLHSFASTSTVFSVCFNRDGTRLATGNREGILQLWDTHTGLETFALKDHPSEVWSVCFSPSGNALVSSSRVVKVWDAGPVAP
jgi:WD40 repeat protein